MISNTIKHKLLKKVSLYLIKTRNYVKPINKGLKYAKKQYLPATKEWSDSIYTFNKNNIKSLVIKNLIAERFIKKFFYIVKRNRHTARSRRMRNLLVKFKTNRLFFSKPEVKQTNDKSIITIYNYDREKELLIKKFFYYKKLIKTPKKKTLFLRNKIKYLRKRFSLKRLPLSGRRLNLEIRLYEKKLFNKINNLKKNKKKSFFFKYLFIRWILSIIGFKINFLTTKFKTNRNKFLVLSKNKGINKYQQYMLANLGFIYKNKKSIKILFNNNFMKKNLKHNYIINYDNFTKLNKNLFLFSILKKLLYFNKLDSSYSINILYKWYKKKYYKKFLKTFLLKKIKFDNIRIFYANKVKFNKYLPLLKLFLRNIYNKNIEINLINLKYPYLSSDIFVYSLATRLRDRTRRLVTTVNKYLTMIKLIKLPLYIRKDTKYNNKYYIINKEKKKIDKNIMDLSNIRSKWITGMRLETSGRLTNRYVAQRSVYKHRYGGNLKSRDYKPIRARAYISPNLQKSYVQSIRRIGAFGIKGWISSN